MKGGNEWERNEIFLRIAEGQSIFATRHDEDDDDGGYCGKARKKIFSSPFHIRRLYEFIVSLTFFFFFFSCMYVQPYEIFYEE